MAPKTASNPDVLAPLPGVDEEFDQTWEKVREALETAGNPEGLNLEIDGDPTSARNTLAAKMTKFGGKSYPQTDYRLDEVIAEEDEAEPYERALIIPKPGDAPIWWDDPLQAEFIDHFILTRRALGNAFRGGLLITGHAGIGKTEGVPHAIDRINAAHGLDIRLMKMDCPTVTDEGKWFGRRELDGKGTRYEKSDLVISIERGDVVLLDEIGRLHPRLHNGIMPFLDGSNEVHLSDLNVTIKRHPQTVFIATTNIGNQYGGTYRMDWAMRERFPFTIERGWPPADVETAILTSHTGCDEDGASQLVVIAGKARGMFEGGDLKFPISTRTLVAAAWLVASGMTEKEALELTAVPLYDPDANGLAGEESERTKVRQIIGGRMG